MVGGQSQADPQPTCTWPCIRYFRARRGGGRWINRRTLSAAKSGNTVGLERVSKTVSSRRQRVYFAIPGTGTISQHSHTSAVLACRRRKTVSHRLRRAKDNLSPSLSHSYISVQRYELSPDNEYITAQQNRGQKNTTRDAPGLREDERAAASTNPTETQSRSQA